MTTSPSNPPYTSTFSSTPTGDPGAVLIDLMLGHIYSGALRTAVELGIADCLADGPLTPEEIAGRTGTHAPSLRRVLRLLASRGVFSEDEKGAFGLTPAAELLRADAPVSQHDGTLLLTNELFQRSVAGMTEAVRTGVPAFEAAYGSPLFAYLATQPELQKLFDRGMSSFSGPLDDIVTAAYEFPAEGTVIDVGGGRGGLLRAVLQRNPGLSGVLFDQEQTVREHILDVPELAGRWRTEPGDFFAKLPGGGDVYLLKNILHDWNDEDSVRILRGLREAVQPGVRLLVVEAVLPAGNEPHYGKAADIIMLSTLWGKERTEAEFAALLRESGFSPVRVVPTASWQSIVEAEAV